MCNFDRDFFNNRGEVVDRYTFVSKCYIWYFVICLDFVNRDRVRHDDWQIEDTDFKIFCLNHNNFQITDVKCECDHWFYVIYEV